MFCYILWIYFSDLDIFVEIYSPSPIPLLLPCSFCYIFMKKIPCLIFVFMPSFCGWWMSCFFLYWELNSIILHFFTKLLQLLNSTFNSTAVFLILWNKNLNTHIIFKCLVKHPNKRIYISDYFSIKNNHFIIVDADCPCLLYIALELLINLKETTFWNLKILIYDCDMNFQYLASL